jgi:NAD(P)-dependent dehydrogenase (short-subunit alcohol dehydrogenase family)
VKVLNEEKRARITAPGVSVEDVNAFASEFIASVEAGTHVEDGWPSINLGMSQLGKIAFHKALARREADSGILFMMACPGHCRTDMSSQNGAKSAEEGSTTPAMLALMTVEAGAESPNGKVSIVS